MRSRATTDPRRAAAAPGPALGLTVADVARRWRVSPDRVRSLIRRGLLAALALPGPRPRLVVTPDQLAAAERAMAAGPPAQPARRRRRAAVVDYYTSGEEAARPPDAAQPATGKEAAR